MGLLADRLPPAALEVAMKDDFYWGHVHDYEESFLYWRLHQELAYPLTLAMLGCLNKENAKVNAQARWNESKERVKGFVPLEAHPARAIDFPGRVVPGQKAHPQPSRARAPRGLLGAPAGPLTPRPLAARLRARATAAAKAAAGPPRAVAAGGCGGG